MKTLIITILLCSIYPGVVSAQAASDEQKVKSKVDLIINLCKEEKYDSFASMVIYSGKDKERYLRDTYNYSERKEATTVKRIGKKIKAFIDLSDSRTFGKYTVTTENGISKKNLEVIFKKGEQELVNVFTFTDLNGKLLLLEFQ
jgi:hypothetical protein